MKFIRTVGPVAVAAVVLGACEPAKYQLMPLEEAMHRMPSPLVAQVHGPAEPIPGVPQGPVRVGDRFWQSVGIVPALPNDFVRPVATVDGLMFHSFAWDEQPFDRLLVASPGAPGVWLEFLEVY